MIRPALLAAALLLAVPILAASAAPATVEYSWINLEHRGGSLKRTTDGRGRVAVEFAYLDNGRGPKLRETIRVDERGVPVAYDLGGTTTFGSAARERFRLAGGRASWETTADRGERPAGAGELYVPINGTPESYAVLVRALLAREGASAAGLPGGTVSVARVRTDRLEHAGRSREVGLYALAGLDVAPVYLWLDEADRQLFAMLWPGVVGVVAQGWEPVAASLVERQSEAEHALLAKVPEVARVPLGEHYAIRDVRVFDSAAAKLGAPSTVFVHRGRIAAVFPAGSAIPDGMPVVEGAGRTLLPALIDMHTHESRWNAALQIAGGVTTARDLGIDRDELALLSKRFDSGEWLGPRLWPTCFIDGESPFSARGDGVANGLEAALAIVDECAKRGYRHVKLYSSFRKDWIRPTAERAKSLGMRVSGHVPAFVRAEEAVELGYDEIQHINQVLLNFVVGPKGDTRTLARFYLVGERVADLDLDSPRVQDFLKLLREREFAIDPTLATFEDMFNQGPGELSTAFAAVVDHLPVSHQRARRQNHMAVTPATLARFRASYAKMLELVRRFDAAGIAIVPGTDEIAGFTLHREYELWVKAGIAPARVLQLATRESAQLMGLGHEIGTIAPGYSADLVLVDGNPVEDISAVRRIALVLQRGQAYSPSAIYRTLGIRPFAPDPEIRR